MSKKVEIYSRSNCTYCEMAKKFFDSKDIDYVVYDTGISEIFDEMIKRLSLIHI